LWSRLEQALVLGQVRFDLPAGRGGRKVDKKKPPKNTPTLNEVVRLVAQLGGFLGRKHGGEPGAKTLWLGMRQLAGFVQGIRLAKMTL